MDSHAELVSPYPESPGATNSIPLARRSATVFCPTQNSSRYPTTKMSAEEKNGMILIMSLCWSENRGAQGVFTSFPKILFRLAGNKNRNLERINPKATHIFYFTEPGKELM